MFTHEFEALSKKNFNASYKWAFIGIKASENTKTLVIYFGLLFFGAQLCNWYCTLGFCLGIHLIIIYDCFSQTKLY